MKNTFNMKAKRWILVLGLGAFALSISGCKKDNDIDKDSVIQKSNIVISNNRTELSKRLQFKDELIPINTGIENSTKSTKDFPPIDLTKNYAFKLKAEVNPPVYQEQALQATHVYIQGNYAFVSYNTRGEVYRGGVEVFDISDVRYPQIISQAIFPSADISSLAYADGKLYVVGAMEQYEEAGLAYPAFFEVLNLNSQMEITGVDTIIGLTSYVATGIEITSNRIYITTGSNGHLIVFDRNLNFMKQEAIAFARSVAFSNEKVYVLAAEPGKVLVYNHPSASFEMIFSTGGAETPESKSELAVTDAYVFAALNEAGMKMFDKYGNLKQHIPKPVAPVGSSEDKHVTNSVSINSQLLLLGNGESGIHVGATIPQFNDSIVMLGSMVFGGSQSANFVKSKNDVIFVASGLGGLKIIGISIDEGIPDSIIPTEPCPLLLPAISAQFPESQNAMINHPDLFLPENARNVITTEETPVYVVFVDEGAGWRNTFGYYAYPLDNPPASMNDITHHVVFPNVSKVGEGGGLDQGDMVYLGDFPANYVIGFYLVAKGWQNGMMVPGVYTHYTNIQFNPQSIQQHLLFVESSCNDLVLTFEDIRLPGGDKDFNDIILVIKDNPNQIPNTKFDYSNIPVK